MIVLSELIEQRNELEQRRRMVADLETNLISVCFSLVNQVQVTGEGKGVATVGKETSFELSLSSPSATSPISSLFTSSNFSPNPFFSLQISFYHRSCSLIRSSLKAQTLIFLPIGTPDHSSIFISISFPSRVTPPKPTVKKIWKYHLADFSSINMS